MATPIPTPAAPSTHTLREAEVVGTVDAVCARPNVSKSTFYGGKQKYGGPEVSQARRLRSLEEENSRLKRLVAVRAVPAGEFFAPAVGLGTPSGAKS